MSDEPSAASEQLTTEELAELQKFLGSSSGAPSPKEDHNVHRFLYEVLNTKDTTKVGYLTQEELGVPRNPVRTMKRISLFCNDIMDKPGLAAHFAREAEIVNATSLSKNAKLLMAAITAKRELSDVTPEKEPRKPSSSWFKKKNKPVSDSPTV